MMEKRPTQFMFIISVSVLLLGVLAAAGIALEAPQRPIEIKGVAKKCLACHSYDKIREATAKYKAPSGETVTPHQYIPHKDKETGRIPDCTECHTEHPVPLEDKSKVVMPKGIDFCYNACHHMNNLVSCTACHQ
jgi:hypothetical protein